MRIHVTEAELAVGVELNIDGFATKVCEPGFGGIIYLEKYDGKIQVHVWADHNQEGPTHTIDLAKARV